MREKNYEQEVILVEKNETDFLLDGTFNKVTQILSLYVYIFYQQNYNLSCSNSAFNLILLIVMKCELNSNEIVLIFYQTEPMQLNNGRV